MREADREMERERGGREREREGESDVEGVGAKTRVAVKAEIGRLELTSDSAREVCRHLSLGQYAPNRVPLASFGFGFTDIVLITAAVATRHAPWRSSQSRPAAAGLQFPSSIAQSGSTWECGTRCIFTRVLEHQRRLRSKALFQSGIFHALRLCLRAVNATWAVSATRAEREGRRGGGARVTHQ